MLWEHWKCFEKLEAANDESISRETTVPLAGLFVSAEGDVLEMHAARQAEPVSHPY